VTVKVTGSVKLPSDEVIVTEPVYVPAARLLAFAVTFRLSGVAPL
jgi:hypothetical protein